MVGETQYTFINSEVKNLNYSYFELSSNQAGNIQFEIVLLVQDENGEYFIFGQPETFYANRDGNLRTRCVMERYVD